MNNNPNHNNRSQESSVPRRGPGSGGPMMGGMGAGGQKPKNFKKALLNLYGFMGGYKLAFLIAILLGMAGTAFVVLFPNILSRITTEIIKGITIPGASINLQRIGEIGILLITLYVASALLNYLQSFILVTITQKISYRIREQISQKINKLPLRYYDKHSQGDILSRVTNDVDTISQSLSQSFSQMINAMTSVVGFLIIMFTVEWRLALVAISTLPLSTLFIALTVKKSQKYFSQQQKQLGKLNGIIEESYGAHAVVKAFNVEKRFIQTFNTTNSELQISAHKSQFVSGIMMPVMGFIGNLGYVAICVVGGLIARGPLDIANIQQFLQYVRQFNQPVSQIAQASNLLQSTAAASERVFEFLNEEDEVETGDRLVDLAKVVGEIEFDHVRFGYSEEKTVIKDFSIQIKPGQKVAIVGPTGAGKTTIVNLLMRFYDVQSGTIKVDGVDLKEYKRSEVRKLFGMVLQDTWLFQGSMCQNIAYSSLGQDTPVDMEHIKTITKEAHIDHFIMSQPKGYETCLNENADNISNGQKQLLTIARAMYENSPMLILDEATSSVDTRSEILIQRAMANLLKNRTSFIIAHRLSTIRDADLILVMKEGEIVEMGNHEQLMQQAGFYKTLYNSQFEE